MLIAYNMYAYFQHFHELVHIHVTGITKSSKTKIIPLNQQKYSLIEFDEMFLQIVNIYKKKKQSWFVQVESKGQSCITKKNTTT